MGSESTWPNCGHPKTDENTRKVGGGRVACRECRRLVDKRRLEMMKEQANAN